MKKGMVVYITAGKEEAPTPESCEQLQIPQLQDVSALCVATSEDEVAYGWWQMITRGMHQVLFMTAAYDPVVERFEPHGSPVRLWG
jgi:hypothetical protein